MNILKGFFSVVILSVSLSAWAIEGYNESPEATNVTQGDMPSCETKPGTVNPVCPQNVPARPLPLPPPQKVVDRINGTLGTTPAPTPAAKDADIVH